MARATPIDSLSGSAAAVAVTLSALLARAQASEVVPYAVEYHVPAACPEEAAFTGLIARRTSRARRAPAAEARYRFTVGIVLDEAGARGSLRIVEHDGGTTERDVPARDCSDAVEAMALIAAVILDPRAATQIEAGAAPASSAPAPAAPEPTAPARSAEARPAREAAPPVARKAPPARAAVAGEPWRFRARIDLLAQGAVADESAFGGGVGLEAFSLRRGWLEPRAALTANLAFAETDTRFGTAHFRFYAGRFVACPLKTPGEGRLVLRACGFADAGVLHGRGSDTLNARSSTAFWASLGPALEIELQALSSVALAWQAGLAFPLTRDRFLFAPQEVAHEIPAAGLWFAASLRPGPL